MKPHFIRSKIERLDGIPTIPQVERQLLPMIESDRLSFKDLGEMISRGQAVTARLLKMVNSPVYGFPGRISSVPQALILLGLHVVKGVLLGVSVFEIMERAMVGLWNHSLFTALVAREIAVKKGLSEPEEVMTSALLHDIGKVALKVNFTAEYNRALALSQERDLLIKDAEEEVFSLSHSMAGGWLTRKWNFPITLSEPIAYHHKPALTKHAPLHTAIVHMADILVRARGIGFGGDDLVPPLDAAVWRDLFLFESDVRDILQTVEDMSHDSMSVSL
jgi:putative nucleotidyltransferase with HDIG domain